MALEGESLLLLLLPVLTQAVAPELVALMVALIDEEVDVEFLLIHILSEKY